MTELTFLKELLLIRQSKEGDICQYWCFLHKSFKVQSNVCSGCHDLLIMSMNLSDTAIF